MNEHAHNADAVDPVDHDHRDVDEPAASSALSDPVGAVVTAYLDFLEGQGEPPALDDLEEAGPRPTMAGPVPS
jgi:hypothetical protein